MLYPSYEQDSSQKSFEVLKSVLLSSPILVYPALIEGHIMFLLPIACSLIPGGCDL